MHNLWGGSGSRRFVRERNVEDDDCKEAFLGSGRWEDHVIRKYFLLVAIKLDNQVGFPSLLIGNFFCRLVVQITANLKGSPSNRGSQKVILTLAIENSLFVSGTNTRYPIFRRWWRCFPALPRQYTKPCYQDCTRDRKRRWTVTGRR